MNRNIDQLFINLSLFSMPWLYYNLYINFMYFWITIIFYAP